MCLQEYNVVDYTISEVRIMIKFSELFPYNTYLKNIVQKLREINDQLLSEYGLNTSQGMLLGNINRALVENIEINRKYLEEVMGISGPSVTNLLNGLEKMDFIKRVNSTADGRNLNIVVTNKAKELIDKMGNVFDISEGLLTTGMSDAEMAMFLSLLCRANDNVNEYLCK
jgi:MarR family transcriptional repressor of mepA